VTVLVFCLWVAGLVLAVAVRVMLRKRYKQGMPGMRDLDRFQRGEPRGGTGTSFSPPWLRWLRERARGGRPPPR
jgi:hypothetical protein